MFRFFLDLAFLFCNKQASAKTWRGLGRVQCQVCVLRRLVAKGIGCRQSLLVDDFMILSLVLKMLEYTYNQVLPLNQTCYHYTK